MLRNTSDDTAPDHVSALLDANDRFYDAFESRDRAAMQAIWSKSDESICVHPGWGPIYGAENIGASWYLLLSNGEQLHFVVSDARVLISGDIGTVTCIEEMLDGKQAGRAFASNTFILENGEWKLLSHISGGIYG